MRAAPNEQFAVPPTMLFFLWCTAEIKTNVSTSISYKLTKHPQRLFHEIFSDISNNAIYHPVTTVNIIYGVKEFRDILRGKIIKEKSESKEYATIVSKHTIRLSGFKFVIL